MEDLVNQTEALGWSGNLEENSQKDDKDSSTSVFELSLVGRIISDKSFNKARIRVM